MKLQDVFLRERNQVRDLFSYIVFLERSIREKNGIDYLESLQAEFVIYQMGPEAMKKLLQYLKLESASTSSPTLPLTGTGT